VDAFPDSILLRVAENLRKPVSGFSPKPTGRGSLGRQTLHHLQRTSELLDGHAGGYNLAPRSPGTFRNNHLKPPYHIDGTSATLLASQQILQTTTNN
jgi:hypothetical protein